MLRTRWRVVLVRAQSRVVQPIRHGFECRHQRVCRKRTRRQRTVATLDAPQRKFPVHLQHFARQRTAFPSHTQLRVVCCRPCRTHRGTDRIWHCSKRYVCSIEVFSRRIHRVSIFVCRLCRCTQRRCRRPPDRRVHRLHRVDTNHHGDHHRNNHGDDVCTDGRPNKCSDSTTSIGIVCGRTWLACWSRQRDG